MKHDEIIPIPPDASSNEFYVKQLEIMEEIDRVFGVPEKILRYPEEVRMDAVEAQLRRHKRLTLSK